MWVGTRRGQVPHVGGYYITTCGWVLHARGWVLHVGGYYTWAGTTCGWVLHIGRYYMWAGTTHGQVLFCMASCCMLHVVGLSLVWYSRV